MFLRRNEKETPADFLVEIPFEDNEKKEKPKEVPDSNSKWRLYTDGASNSNRSGAGLMLIDPEGKEYTYALCFEFETTNNEAEYKALLAGLRIAQEMEIAKVEPKQESRRTKQAGINDLQTSHKGSASRSFDQKVNRGKRSFEGRYEGEEKLDGPHP
ncbi:reverse transcriptase domain-containing protein [Tanacetum coccineum]